MAPSRDLVFELAGRVVRGEPRSVARAISLVENESPDAIPLIQRLHEKTGRAYLVGVTGPPGAGKSTLVDRLITLVRGRGLTAGVIAVDPSSPFTGGAILGDRVRMSAHASDDGVFIRSMATRGHLGGVARATSDAVAVLDASGKDVVFVETVGVGQDEVDIVRTADVSVLVLVPGAGDDVQAIKAGIMEIADIFVVNKADRDGSERAAEAVGAALSLRTYAAGEWRPPILKTEATSGAGVDALWAAVEQFRDRADDGRTRRRRERQQAHLRDLLVRWFLQRAERSVPNGEWENAVDRILSHAADPYTVATELMSRICRSPDDARAERTQS
ncbi:MAG TPA: methylmalonyl Co-A mutase-associated GTPase MeaB [Vicinamibacterales bacterium]|nr:methylmalonyl Co-A mutase-associated GTPase MeaB [Vicinamibacterales bacterium]